MSHELFFKLQGAIMNLGNKLTLFQITVCETAVTKIDFLKNTRTFTFFI